MALVVYDRVQQTGFANTTVSFTLSGSVTGFQSFAVVGNGNTTYYAATDSSGNWEVGIGTYSTTGPTLTRTTILSSSNSGSAVTFSGTVTVFVTYPSERSVNLDSSGNVTALGTISSGTWQGTTVGVAYGGTGVTTSSGANSVVLRDANQNVTANNFLAGYTSTATAGGTTTLTVASTQYQRFTGTTTQTVKLPDATTLQKGFVFSINNGSTGNLTIVDNASTTLDTIISGSIDNWVLLDNSTTAGTWIAYSLLPSSYDFNNTTASFGNASIINSTWNGVTIATGYGGTGLTTFSAANNAIYSTSSSALTAGTLPVLAGGTNSTSTPTAGGAVYGTGSAYAITAAGTTGQVLTSAGTSAPTWSTPIALSGTNTWTGTQSFTGSTSVLAAILTNAAEVCTVSATAATGTIAYYPSTQSVLYYTSNASANWTTNFTFSAGTTLNTAMTTGQSLTVAFLVTQGATAYYNNVVQVDGTTSGVTTKWQGSAAPTAGNASSVDVYTYSIVKTGSATFTVFATQTQFK